MPAGQEAVLKPAGYEKTIFVGRLGMDKAAKLEDNQTMNVRRN